jgi:hypothetical protein
MVDNLKVYSHEGHIAVDIVMGIPIMKGVEKASAPISPEGHAGPHPPYMQETHMIALRPRNRHPLLDAVCTPQPKNEPIAGEERAL